MSPNAAEWAMDVEDVLRATNAYTDLAESDLEKVKFHNGNLEQYVDSLVAQLKRVLRNYQ